MSAHDFQHELADELLSAYLDDELSPAERAAVESRLANDPTAQQMLHQLRSVSQSIQHLPLESVGADVRGKILNRIKELEPSAQPKVAADVQPSSASDVLPKITVFSSRRSWIWASLAVAAGLLIMVLERGEVQNKQLSAIAKHDADTAVARRLDETSRRDEIGHSSGVTFDSSSVVAAEKPSPAPAPAPVAAPPAPAAPVASSGPSSPPVQLGVPLKPADELAMSERRAVPAAAPASDGVPTAGLAIGGRGGGAPPELRGGAAIATNSAGAASMPAAVAPKAKVADEKLAYSTGEARETGVPTDSFVVVHVLAKPAAIQNRAFDKLLLSNGINIESDSRGEEESLGDKVQQPSDTDQAAREFGSLKMPQQARQVDMVLVDAPESAVKSCLADLQKDADNYAGVEVDDTANTDRSKQRLQLEGKAAFDLGQYNRGLIPPQQKANFRNQISFQAVERQQLAKTEAAASSEPVTNGPTQLNLQELLRVQQRVQSSDNRARALRFLPSNPENLQRAALGPEEISTATPAIQSAATPPTQQIAEPSVKKLADSNLQVLFMLSPADEAAASTPAEKKAE